MSKRLKQQLRRVNERMERIKPTKSHIRVTTIEIPDGIRKADRERFEEEARATLPEDDKLLHDMLIIEKFVAGDGRGGFKYPEGRDLEPGETWKFIDSNIQPIVPFRRRNSG